MADLFQEDAQASDRFGAAYRLEEFRGPRRVTCISGEVAGYHEAAAGGVDARVLEGEASVRATVGTVVEGRVDIGGEIPVGADKGEAERAGGDKVGGEASDLAPSGLGEAPFVNKSGQDFEGEDDIASHRRDEAGEADDSAGIVKAVNKDDGKAGVGEEQFQSVVGDRVAGGKVGFEREGVEDELELVDGTGAG